MSRFCCRDACNCCCRIFLIDGIVNGGRTAKGYYCYKGVCWNRIKKYFMRAGPQLGVDAFSISNYGSAMFAQVQPQHSPLMLLTPTASAASLGHVRLQ